jgi:hypothetical protein
VKVRITNCNFLPRLEGINTTKRRCKVNTRTIKGWLLGMTVLMLGSPNMAQSCLLQHLGERAWDEVLDRCNFGCMGEAAADAVCNGLNCSGAEKIREEEERLRKELEARERLREKAEVCTNVSDTLCVQPPNACGLTENGEYIYC